MKKEFIKEIFEKYKNGQTSLEEEQFLFRNSADVNFPLANWITSEKNNKKELPKNFNERLWESFDKKTQSKNKTLKRVFIAAASITLFFNIYIKNQKNKTQSNWEKEVLLMEAKSMFLEIEENVNEEIIFEDDLIVLYTKTK